MVRHDRSLHKQFRWSHDFHLMGKILLIITNGQWHSGVRYRAMGQVVIEDTGNYYYKTGRWRVEGEEIRTQIEERS